MAELKLKDGDYVLEDGCAWVAVGGFAVRLFTHPSGGVRITVCPDGKEYTTLDDVFYPKELLDADI